MEIDATIDPVDSDSRGLTDGLRSLASGQPRAVVRQSVLTRLGLGDLYFPFETDFADIFVAYNRIGVSAVQLMTSTSQFEEEFKARFRRPAFPADESPKPLVRRIEAALQGDAAARPAVDLSSVTAFEREVLLKALEIPFGQVRPYGWIAREIGRPSAQRAVGSALGGNPIPLLIPCHRVVRSDGIIGNYGMGGPVVKKRILEAEGADPQALEQLARTGRRYAGSRTTHIFCFPTCRHARRIRPNNLVHFASPEDASGAGYRPCKVCRPAE